jgi:peptidoglycan/LPS O-acetylase OafA/YrhL
MSASAVQSYNAALDGIRAVAIAAVMAFHARAPWVSGGYLGVDVFFVLSGFLITRMLHEELVNTGRLSLARFYGRRAVRLYPTLLIMLAAVLWAAPVFWPERHLTREAIIAALYLSDYSHAFFGTPLVLTHTWSLSVEEHFYLLWPLVLPWVLRRPDGPRWLLRLFVCLVVWRVASLALVGWVPTYFRFDARASGLVLGSWLALARLRDMPRWIGWCALALLVPLGVLVQYGTVSGLDAAVIVAEACAAGLIVAAIKGTGPARLLARPPLAYIGRLSYGLYLWHYPIMFWMRERYDWTVTLAVGGALSFVLAAASYTWVDMPLQGLKKRLGTTHRPGSAIDPPTAWPNAAKSRPPYSG